MKVVELDTVPRSRKRSVYPWDKWLDVPKGKAVELQREKDFKAKEASTVRLAGKKAAETRKLNRKFVVRGDILFIINPDE